MQYEGIGPIVALDGGTTNTRARLVCEGRVVATARRALGVRDSVLDPAEGRPLHVAVRQAIAEVLQAGGLDRPDLIVAAGMLSSEVGLAQVPHVEAPAGLEELARASRFCAIAEIADEPLLFVPGVRTPPGDGPDGWTDADVMRGEECETLGVLTAGRLAGPLALLWPGSHTKLVEVDARNRIVQSFTTLAGEMTATLARQTLLAASLPTSLPVDPDPQALATAARIVARDGLARAAFLVRVAALTGALSLSQRAGFWVGAVLADDADHLARHAILRTGRVPIWVGGGEPLRSLYTRALADRLDTPVEALGAEEAEHASALGALAVATRVAGDRQAL